MSIATQTAKIKPPSFYYHEVASNDTAADLNEWATGLFSPRYSDTAPAFSVDSGGLVHTVADTRPCPAGFFLVLDEHGEIHVLAGPSFARRYAPDAT